MRGTVRNPATGQALRIEGEPVFVERPLSDDSGTYRDYGGASLLAQAMQRARQRTGGSRVPEPRVEPGDLLLAADPAVEDLSRFDRDDKVPAEVAETMLRSRAAGGRLSPSTGVPLPAAWDEAGGDPSNVSAPRKRGEHSLEYAPRVQVPYRRLDGSWAVATIRPGDQALTRTINPDALHSGDRDETLTYGGMAQLLNAQHKTPVIAESALVRRQDEGRFSRSGGDKEFGFLRNLSFAPEAPTAALGGLSPDQYSFSGRRPVKRGDTVYLSDLTTDDGEPLYRIGSPYARFQEPLRQGIADLLAEAGLPTGARALGPAEVVEEAQRRSRKELAQGKRKRVTPRMLERGAAGGMQIGAPDPETGVIGFVRSDGSEGLLVPEVALAAGDRPTKTLTGNYLAYANDEFARLAVQPYGVGPVLPDTGLRRWQERRPELGRAGSRPGVPGMSMFNLIRDMSPMNENSGTLADVLGAGANRFYTGVSDRMPVGFMQDVRARRFGRDLERAAARPAPPSAATSDDALLAAASGVDMPEAAQVGFDALVDYNAEGESFGTGFRVFGRPDAVDSNRLAPFVAVAQHYARDPDQARIIADQAMRTAPAAEDGQVPFEAVVREIQRIAAPEVKQYVDPNLDPVARRNRRALREAYGRPAAPLPPLAEIVPDPVARRGLVELGLNAALDSDQPGIQAAAERLLVERQLARARGSAYTALDSYYTPEGVMASRPGAVASADAPSDLLERARAAYQAAVDGQGSGLPPRQGWIPGMASAPTELAVAPDRAHQRVLDYWARAGRQARAEAIAQWGPPQRETQRQLRLSLADLYGGGWEPS
jgi:hypothetical protein